MSSTNMSDESWKTKPTDRFVLKFIKLHFAARITPLLVRFGWLSPWMITVFSAIVGVAAGLAYALGHGFVGGLLAAGSQIFDGVDGQFARLTGRASRAGAFLDSVLDRYADAALVIGLTFLVHVSLSWVPIWASVGLGFAALVGSGLVSYGSARAESLGIDLGGPTLASKGTRTTVIIIAGLLSAVWSQASFWGLAYLAIHTHLVLFYRLFRVCSESGNEGS